MSSILQNSRKDKVMYIVFIDSSHSCGIQCADFCAGAIHKKFENNEDTFFKSLLPAIRANKLNNFMRIWNKII